MKNSGSQIILSFLLILLTLGKNITAQDCPIPEAYGILNGNNIRASIPNNGNLFWAKRFENNTSFYIDL